MNRRQRPGGMHAHVMALLIGALALWAPAGGQDAAEEALPKPPAKDFTGTPTCEILSVRAGNLLVARVDGAETTIRLIGTYVPQNGPAADEARAFTARLLQGESVYLEYDPNWPRRDRDDRLWAYVYRAPDGLFVNLELVREGFARISSAELFVHEPLLRAYERVARRAQKGLWSPRAAQAEDPPTSRPAPEVATRPATPAPDGSADAQVYVTKSGKKYHRKDCQFVKDGATAMTVKQAQAQGLTPCSRCKPPQ
jgi:micrococcal nuclease